MVRLRLSRILKQRKMTPYALSKVTGLSLPTVYNLTKPDGVKRLEFETIDRLCAALRCDVADLLIRVK